MRDEHDQRESEHREAVATEAHHQLRGITS